jgi:protein subunit release factor B
VVRVYQFEGSERVVRDLRTQQRTSDVAAVLDGGLDDFILAYLRDEETVKAWKE